MAHVSVHSCTCALHCAFLHPLCYCFIDLGGPVGTMLTANSDTPASHPLARRWHGWRYIIPQHMTTAALFGLGGAERQMQGERRTSCVSLRDKEEAEEKGRRVGLCVRVTQCERLRRANITTVPGFWVGPYWADKGFLGLAQDIIALTWIMWQG